LLRLWAQHLQGHGTLLATSDSNIAVDNIAAGAVKAGLNVVRLGRTEKVTPELEGATLEAKFRQRVGGKGGAKGKNKGWTADLEVDDDDEWEGQKRRRMEDHEVRMSILKEAQVICTTTIAAGGEILSELNICAILIDEVAQATELSAAVPILLRGGERLVLVGDHCQLPPTVSSAEADARGLGLSLFGRFVNHGLTPHFLDTQFRMHPSIAQFSAQEFYEGQLKTGVDEADRPQVAGFEWPLPDSNIAFVDVADGWEAAEGTSWTNRTEVEEVTELVLQVLAAGELGTSEIGVVSPYSAQVQALRQHVRSLPDWQLEQRGIDLTRGGLVPRRKALRDLEIASIDAFQGREKELIVFTAVRSNNKKQVGFLADWRRLNVMITRARRGLIVVGNAATLTHNRHWGRWLEHAPRAERVASAEAYYGEGHADESTGESPRLALQIRGTVGKGTATVQGSTWSSSTYGKGAYW